MSWFDALILGIIQGLAEFLPISSKTHIALYEYIRHIELKENLTFSVILHAGTVLSTLIIFRREIGEIFKSIFTLKWNDTTRYALKLVLSVIPVAVIAVMYKDMIKELFKGNLFLIVSGSGLLVTAFLLALTNRLKQNTRRLSFLDSIVIGIAQSLAVLPGISRSGATITTGLFLGIKKEEVAKFSFLMVLIPVIGDCILDMKKITSTESSLIVPCIIGFVTSFIVGLITCKSMINLVKRGKLIYFAIYCAIIGAIAIFAGM